MIALIQRVKHAQVDINQQTVGKIEHGLLVLLGVEKDDNDIRAAKLLDKILSYRVFSDEAGKMNRHVGQVGGSLLIVSQFTLLADTKNGSRPSFSNGATPDKAQHYYQWFCQEAAKRIHTETGQFGADMQVSLLNDGPVTFWLQS